jgi:hypothetical protein
MVSIRYVPTSFAIVLISSECWVLLDAVWPPTIVRYKLADDAEAHRVSEARHLQGKLVPEV